MRSMKGIDVRFIYHSKLLVLANNGIFHDSVWIYLAYQHLTLILRETCPTIQEVEDSISNATLDVVR